MKYLLIVVSPNKYPTSFSFKDPSTHIITLLKSINGDRVNRENFSKHESRFIQALDEFAETGVAPKSISENVTLNPPDWTIYETGFVYTLIKV